MVIRYRVAAVALLGACSFKTPTELDATPPPTIAFEFDKSGADEKIGTVNLPVVLSKASAHRITAKVSVLAGGSADDADFVLGASEVVFEPDVTRVMVPVTINDDTNENETDEIFTLAISDPVNAELDLEKAIHEVKIADHILPRVKFAQLATSTMENTPSTLRIELTAPSEGVSEVTLGVDQVGTTVDSEDLTVAADTVISIPDGAMFVDVPLGENPDALDEGDSETVAFALRGASQNMVLGTEIAATHTIIDDDNAPTVEFDIVSSTVAEDGVSVTIAVKLSAESGLPITVDYARNAGSTADTTDATISGTQLTFAPHTVGTAGETTKTFTVTITNDNVDEDAEQLLIDLSNATNATIAAKGQHALTISADAADVPTVQFQNSTSTADEDQDNPTINVVLSNPSAKTVTVTYTISGSSTATAGQDYNLTSPGTVTFTALDVSQGIAVDLIPSGVNNPDETLILNLSGPTNATLGGRTSHTLTIRD